MGALAYIFPGQGSQYVGMGSDLASRWASARSVFALADSALGVKLSEICFRGPADELQLTENTQPAILTVSIAALGAMRESGFPEPAFVAGHSLGEYSALVAAGALPFVDAVRAVRARGRYMQEACPVGSGAMAAILGADLRDVMESCIEAQQGEVCTAANINSPGQVVIAGHTSAVARAMEVAKSRGAKRAVQLNVSAPFHCALMKPAEERLATDLAVTEFSDLAMPLVTNSDAEEITSGEDARKALVRQVSSPVRWHETIELLIRNGVDKFVEVGPGKVLSGLVRQINRTVRAYNVEDSASLEKALLELNQRVANQAAS